MSNGDDETTGDSEAEVDPGETEEPTEAEMGPDGTEERTEAEADSDGPENQTDKKPDSDETEEQVDSEGESDGTEDQTENESDQDEAEEQTETETDADENEEQTEEESTETEDSGPGISAFESRLDELEGSLEAAETESDLDDVEATTDTIEDDLESASFPVPEPEDEDEEPEEPKEPLESKLEEIRESIENQRGPYAEDVQSNADDAAGLIRETRWTRDGKPAVRTAVDNFLDTASDALDTAFTIEGDGIDPAADAVEQVGQTAIEQELDADEDAETIAALLDAVGALESALDDAEEWDDLEIAEQLEREGFYDRLVPENRKDFPPELGVVRIAEAENDPERILMALDSLDSEFMEENCIDALRRLGPDEALEPMLELAQRRDQGAIEVLGKIGDDRAVEPLTEFVNSGNPPLQIVTIRALGEIGSTEASQEIANALDDDESRVRSIAARALGLIGDTRAIEPLSARLADETEADEVRASAAWALVRIGTERALHAAAEYEDDRAYIVQREAKRASEAGA